MTRTLQSKIAPSIAVAAANWFAHLQEDDATEQDFQEWQRWLNADPEHQRAYREIEQAWRLIGDVKPAPWPSSANSMLIHRGPKHLRHRAIHRHRPLRAERGLIVAVGNGLR